MKPSDIIQWYSQLGAQHHYPLDAKLGIVVWFVGNEHCRPSIYCHLRISAVCSSYCLYHIGLRYDLFIRPLFSVSYDKNYLLF